jgi:hypothetical protein
MVTLVAGKDKDKKSFIVHKNGLCEASPFLNAACKPAWMKDKNGYIIMPEDEAEVVRVMIYWIYHDEVCIKELQNERNIDTCPKALSTPWGLFTKLYVIGQKYQMPRLQNAAIDAILYHHRSWHFQAGIIQWVYENTNRGDNLRKLVFRIARKEIDTEHFTFFLATSIVESSYSILRMLRHKDTPGN